MAFTIENAVHSFETNIDSLSSCSGVAFHCLNSGALSRASKSAFQGTQGLPEEVQEPCDVEGTLYH